MESSSTYTTAGGFPDCEGDAALVQLPFNRFLKITGFVLCILSIPLLLYALKKWIIPGAFHHNIKILLVCYFVNALLNALSLSTFIPLMIYKSYADTPCAVYLNKIVYTLGHLQNFYFLLTQITIQTMACIERVIATLEAGPYGLRGPGLGVFFALLATLSPLPIGYLMYHDENFDVQAASVMNPPPGMATRINLIFLYGISQCILSLLLVQFLKRYNKRRVNELVGKVSCRFQTNENIHTTSFIVVIISLQLSIYLIAGVGILVLRLTADLYDPYNLTFKTLKTSLFIVPVFFFALPLLTIWEFRNVKRRRQKHSFEHIAIKTTGEEGIENYKKVIYDQW